MAARPKKRCGLLALDESGGIHGDHQFLVGGDDEDLDLGIGSGDLQLLAALENPVPEGLTLELTAARDDGEFSLRNASAYTVEYGGANRVERREADAWVPVLGSRDIFPEAPEPLRSGERLYGMTAWSRDGTVLSPGQYRYLMLVLVWEDGERRPVVLSAEFTIPE